MRSQNNEIPTHKHSVFRRWMLSYLLILLIPVLGAAIAGSYTHAVITDEIAKCNQIILRNLLTEIDVTLAQMERVVTSIIVDSRIVKLLQTDNVNTAFITQVPDIVKMFYSLQFPFDGMEIALYLHAQDYLVTATTANTLSALHASLVYNRQTSLTLDSYQANIRDRYEDDTYHLMESPLYSRHGQPVVFMARTINTAITQRTHAGATIFITIPVEQIAGYNSQDNETRLLILDEKGEVLHAAPAFEENPPILPMEPSEDVCVLEVNGNPYIFSSIHSQRSGFTFSLLTPERTYWESATYASLITAITLIGGVMIGLFSTIFFLRQNYRPVQTLIESLPPSADEPSGNEFDMIHNAFEQLRKEHQGTLGILSTQKEIFRENYLLSRFYGNRCPLSNSDMEAALQLSFKDMSFALVGVLFNPDDRPNTDVWLLDTPQKEDPARLAIHNVFFEALMGYRAYALMEETLLAYLFVLTDEQTGAFEAEMRLRMQACKEKVQSVYGITLSFVLSDIIDSFDGLNRLYRDMIAVAEYQYVVKDSGILQLNGLNCVPAGAPDPDENEKVLLLSDAVLADRAQDAEGILALLLQSLEEEDAIPFYLSRFRIFGWWRTILYICHERVGTTELKRQTQQLVACEDMAALAEQSRRLLRILCGETQAKEGRLSDRVIQHVQEHYQDPNLSLSSIAEEMRLSPKYLSHLFRTESGFGLLDFITSTRVQHSKKLLAQGKNTVQDIAVMVGYTNAKTFRRAFQKLEGVNPGEYAD